MASRCLNPVVVMVSGEYPPLLGGIGDYTRILTSELCATHADVRLYVPEGSTADATHPLVAGTFREWSWSSLS